MSDETEVPLIFRRAAIIPLARSTYRNWSSRIVTMLSLSFSFSFTLLSFLPSHPKHSWPWLTAKTHEKIHGKDCGRETGGRGKDATGLRAPKLKEGITVGNGEGLEGKGGFRSVVAIVETIPNGWMRGMGREKENFLFAHVGTGRSTSLKIICFQSWFGRPRLITWGGTRKAFYQSRL